MSFMCQCLSNTQVRLMYLVSGRHLCLVVVTCSCDVATWNSYVFSWFKLLDRNTLLSRKRNSSQTIKLPIPITVHNTLGVNYNLTFRCCSIPCHGLFQLSTSQLQLLFSRQRTLYSYTCLMSIFLLQQ